MAKEKAEAPLVRFAPHEGVNDVEIAVPDGLLSLAADKVYETRDAVEIRALDEHPQVKRVTAAAAVREQK